jgi:hypothetical protein
MTAYGPVSQLDVGKNGHAWALGPDNQVLWRMGVSEDNIMGTRWTDKVNV